MIDAYGYLRVSGPSQLTGDGFPRQREAITRFAQSAGYRIVKWFEERAVPGAETWERRPAWHEMVTNLNGVRTVIIEKLDRLAREVFIQEYILRDLKERGVTLLSALEPDLYGDPTRDVFRQMMAVIAQYEKAMLVRKLRGARERMRSKTGRCEGRKPYGTRAGEPEVINRMLQLQREGLGFDRIAVALNRAGIKPRSGRAWYGPVVNHILRRLEVQP
jgi:DNA invertase Pin-like site-specific DNA recombinase